MIRTDVSDACLHDHLGNPKLEKKITHTAQDYNSFLNTEEKVIVSNDVMSKLAKKLSNIAGLKKS